MNTIYSPFPPSDGDLEASWNKKRKCFLKAPSATHWKMSVLEISYPSSHHPWDDNHRTAQDRWIPPRFPVGEWHSCCDWARLPNTTTPSSVCLSCPWPPLSQKLSARASMWDTDYSVPLCLFALMASLWMLTLFLHIVLLCSVKPTIQEYNLTLNC